MYICEQIEILWILQSHEAFFKVFQVKVCEKGHDIDADVLFRI